MHKYSQPLLNSLLKHLWHQLQLKSFWVWCNKLWSSSGNYMPFFSSSLHLSSSVRLDGVDAHFQVSPEMFDWVQSQAVAGSLKDIHRVVYKPLLLCASGHCPVERFWMLWTGFSLRLSLYFGALSFSSSLTSPSVPAAENTPTAWGCYQHTLLLGCYSAGDEQSWFPSDMMLRIERILFLRVWGSFRCFFANSRCVFMCLHWRQDWVCPHHHKAQIGGVLQWCLSFCRFLPSAYMITELN